MPDRTEYLAPTSAPPCEGDEPDQLLRRVADGDAIALTKLHETLAADLLDVIGTHLSDSALAKPVLAATFVEVWWMARHHVGGGGSSRSWITDIATRRAVERSRVPAGDQDLTTVIAALNDERLEREFETIQAMEQGRIRLPGRVRAHGAVHR